ncbi:MAG TPA: hypothetical protein VIG80_03235, partial [Bacillaceae bacterium]
GYGKEDFFKTFADHFAEGQKKPEGDGPIFINKENWIKEFERNMDEMKLGKEEYFMVSDDWWRGTMQSLKKEDVLGKVAGITE